MSAYRGAAAMSERYYRVPQNIPSLPCGAPNKNIFFHGVNKSGSLVFADVLRKSYLKAQRANEVFSAYHHVPDLHPRLVDLIHGTSPNGSLFAGHYLYGAIDPAKANGILVTMLRHPLPRILSMYDWLKKEHQDQTEGRSEFKTLREFVIGCRGYGYAQIQQFGMGFGPGWESRWSTFSAREVARQALKSIENEIAWFGLAEYFEESIFSVASICGLPSVPVWCRDNRNETRPLVCEISDDDRRFIEQHFEAEFTFYYRARDIFLSRVAPIDFGPDFAEYRAACASQYKDRLVKAEGGAGVAEALPDEFRHEEYQSLNIDLRGLSKGELEAHYLLYGRNEGRIFRKDGAASDGRFKHATGITAGGT